MRRIILVRSIVAGGFWVFEVNFRSDKVNKDRRTTIMPRVNYARASLEDLI